MSKKGRFPGLVTALLLPLGAAAAGAPEVRVIATYESAGLYWTHPDGDGDCRVRFRAVGETQWRVGFDLWNDARTRECRGSLVHLRPGTRYEAELAGARGPYRASIRFETWSERPPVARTVRVRPGRDMLVIDRGGTRDGYVVFDGGGATFDARDRQPHNIRVTASYVVLRNFVLKGASADAIRIERGAHDVIVEDNDISGWGRIHEDGRAVDMDSGIRASCHSCPEVERVTIRRNRIHSPRHGANSWSKGHPQGPQAITFSYCGGNHVIRDNDIAGGPGRKFNDAIGGEDNFSPYGFPNADSDIYRNRIVGAWDDGIEAEGGNRNVRIWGNTLDDTAIGIATTATSIGPVYIFRNVYDRSRFHEARAPDDDTRGPFFKAGSSPELANGRRYLFHNTMKQRRGDGLRNGLGGGVGIGGTGADQLVRNTWSINNLYQLWRDDVSATSQMGRDNVVEFDLQLGPADNATPRARDRGRRLPNFNDDFRGRAPDIGAEEAG